MGGPWRVGFRAPCLRGLRGAHVQETPEALKSPLKAVGGHSGPLGPFGECGGLGGSCKCSYLPPDLSGIVRGFHITSIYSRATGEL